MGTDRAVDTREDDDSALLRPVVPTAALLEGRVVRFATLSQAPSSVERVIADTSKKTSTPGEAVAGHCPEVHTKPTRPKKLQTNVLYDDIGESGYTPTPM